MSDLIDRQDAIETMAWAIWHYPNLSFLSDYGHAHELAEDALKRLPFTETEIIRCKDCKHFELNKPYVIQGVPILGHEVCDAWGDGCKTSPDGFCFMAESRQDESD